MSDDAPRLTPERLFSDPPLTITPPSSFGFAPDGSLLAYLRVSADDRERMDLCAYDFARKRERVLVDARDTVELTHDVTELTAAERAERERRRQFAYGVTQYAWHPAERRLLVPLDGAAYVGDVGEARCVLELLTPPGTRQTGFRFSPRGNYVSYVRDGDLFFTSTSSGVEARVTRDADETVTNGLPDFLAAEEMSRHHGHWWSPDETCIAYCKVDDACVPLSYRMEIDARGARTIGQRYPFTGGANPEVRLHLFTLEGGTDRCVWRSSPSTPYLARVHYDKLGLMIEEQTRDQQRLRIRRLVGDAWQTSHEETADTWINLTDNFRVVSNEGFVITSEATGTGKVLEVSLDGRARQLAGPTHVNKVLHAADGAVWASGWDATPIEQHLYRIALDGSGYEPLTVDAGWHEVAVSKTGTRFVDRFTSDTTPLEIDVGDLADPAARTRLFAEAIGPDHPYAPFAAVHAYPQFGSIEAEDGQALHYRLTPPRRVTGRHPVIVYVYGGPGAQKARREWSPLLLQLFAEVGFGVLELDNRGSANRGRGFEAAIFRGMGQVEVRDQVRGLEALAAQPWADEARVGVFGHSYGGYMALMCLCQAGERFKAGVAAAPVCDWRLYDTHYTERYMGLPDAQAAAYDAGNVLTHLPKLERPLLLMHGMADDNVLFTHSTMLMAELQRLDKPFELMTYPGAKHSMQERHVSIHRFKLILDFFIRTLGGPR